MRVGCVSDRICVQALIILDGIFVVTCVLVTSLRVMSVEACVSAVETWFISAGCACARLVRLDLILLVILLVPSGFIK